MRWLIICLLVLTTKPVEDCHKQIWLCKKECAKKHRVPSEDWLYCYDECGRDFLRCKR